MGDPPNGCASRHVVHVGSERDASSGADKVSLEIRPPPPHLTAHL